MTSIVCYLIPAYLSFLALESTEKEDDIRYLTYWIVFSLGEVSTPLLRLFFNKFTYMAFRVLLTVALLHPQSGLANLIYNQAVRPFLSQNEQRID
jgi:receptor expression-enhancing protein 5/6